MSIISENQRLHDKQQNEQNFTTVPVNLSPYKWKTERDLKSILTISRTASGQGPGSAREGRKRVRQWSLRDPSPMKQEQLNQPTVTLSLYLVTSCRIWAP